MLRFIRFRKMFAFVMLQVMLLELLCPLGVMALTSGPSQPEMQGFKPIGANDMVDLFSGDFSYNIPLLDVGGYPINLSYQSGSSVDDEASWVGLGWSLNPGTINRQLRGVPDDFSGVDKIKREKSVKPQITYGASFATPLDLVGVPVLKFKGRKGKAKSLNLAQPKVSLTLKADNYRGIGAEIGLNPGLNITDDIAEDNNTAQKPAPKDQGIPSLDLGLTLSSFDGASLKTTFSMMQKKGDIQEKEMSMSIGFPYNSRGGLSEMTLSTSYKNVNKLSQERQRVDPMRSFGGLSFNDKPFVPSIQMPRNSLSLSVSLNAGAEIQVIYAGVGVSGFYSTQWLKDKIKEVPAYGSLYADRGKDIPDALMDLDREKDVPYTSQIPFLPLPVPTYDLFSVASQAGGGQYRVYRGGAGAYFDPSNSSSSNTGTVGLEIGGGNYWDVGADVYYQNTRSSSNKWVKKNAFLLSNDFESRKTSQPLFEPAYFKRVGEPVPIDENYYNLVKRDEPVAAFLPRRYSNSSDGGVSENMFRTKSASFGTPIAGTVSRKQRDVRNNVMSYLTAGEAFNHALDKKINVYRPGVLALNGCNPSQLKKQLNRISSFRRPHHISEISVTDDGGKRSIYGIPVYNVYQEEVTFAIPANPASRANGLINYVPGQDDNPENNKNGIDNYVSKDFTPAYATSYLLTAILSPDYQDLTGNGITDDDNGEAVKFNYTQLDTFYHWRTPYANSVNQANYNEGLLSDPYDDKANYSYGQKEIWYMHSIESKTMVAQFITEDRDDGLGVVDKNGARRTDQRLQRLKEIRLFSKADIKAANGNLSNVVPIKVVHFEYDYSLVSNVPNSVSNGKLTLKKVWFTYGYNNKGALSPYQFTYYTDGSVYGYKQYDRWGVRKDPSLNPGGMNNAEYPYTNQNLTQPRPTDGYVTASQLESIKLPSGGEIKVFYESDDYAFVQNKRAAVMASVSGVLSGGSSQLSSNGLISADHIVIDLPFSMTASDIQSKCFPKGERLYYKCLLDLDAKGHEEYVPGYANILAVAPYGTPTGTKYSQVKITLEKKAQINPIAAAGWQFLRIELPQYAYPGSNNLKDPGTNARKAIRALLSAAGNIKELVVGFEGRAKRQKFSDKLTPAKSWVKVGVPERKLGGGIRVKKIEVSDNWAQQSPTAGSQTTTITQLYDYTTKDTDGTVISSGVASFEPSLGGDENPFRQPVPYQEKQFLGLNTNRYIELPVGESFYPAPSVGYSKVTVRSLGSGDAEAVNRTGTVENEFYTAKEFPTKVSWLNLDVRKPSSSTILSLIGIKVDEQLGLSQGYVIETNDMHGKPKSTTILNKSGDQISKAEYFYKVQNDKAVEKQLSNSVKVINTFNQVVDGTIGLEVELFHDSREQITENLGGTAKASGGLGSILFIPLPFVFPGIAPNYERRSYRALSTVKLIQRFGIVDKVKKTENGSSITTTNLLWDGLTGNVLLTSTQNEFNDPVYSFSYPAHWRYSGMGPAYTNIGSVFAGVSTGANGIVTNTSTAALLFPGDELINLRSSARYWVIRTRTRTSTIVSTRLIDEAGNTVSISNQFLKLVRPGRRNMPNTAIGTIVSLTSPVVNNSINVSALTNIVDAKAFTYSEDWTMPVKNSPLTQTVFGCFSKDCMDLFMWSAFAKKQTLVTYGANSTNVANFFATSANNYTAGQVINRGCTIGEDVVIPSGYANCIPNFFPAPPSSAFDFPFFLNTRRIYTSGANIGKVYVNNNDAGVMGTCTFTINLLNTTAPFNDARLRFFNNNPAPSIDQLRNQMNARLVPVATTVQGRCIFDFTVGRTATFYDCVPSGKDLRPQCYPGADTVLFRVTFNCPPRQVTDPCATPLNRTINPYVVGLLGNWRLSQNFAFQENRTVPRPVVGNPTSTNIRTGGTYAQMVPFWTYASSVWSQVAATELRWIASNEMTLFNNKGLELENRDALNRFSAAQFGYLQSMPVAVASNAMNREIGYDGFEDQGFNLDCAGENCAIPHPLGIRSLFNGTSIKLDQQNVHNGKYSLYLGQAINLLRSSATLDAQGFPVKAATTSFDAGGQYLLTNNDQLNGFSPFPQKEYLISFWVKDNAPTQNTVNLTVQVNGTNVFTSSNRVPVVEKWKRVEARFTTTTGNQVISIIPTGAVYVDDIRIHPYNAQMKSFTYDPVSTRLMAELDENNFSTKYEYDDEGTLIRVKKETEKGIMTIKETRSSMKRN